MTTPPLVSFDQAQHNQALITLIKEEIAAHDGWLSFAAFMQLALYAPALGYYSAGSQKFGKGGDFVTAPEISSLFGQTLARQIAQVLALTQGKILELGAGTGKLAIDVLCALDEMQMPPTQYCILEVSSHLHHLQHENLQKSLPQHLMQRVIWLNELPVAFNGIIVGNEVLDAIPVHIVHHTDHGLYERGIGLDEDQLIWQEELLVENNNKSEYTLTKGVKKNNVCERQLIKLVAEQQLPKNYVTEFCPAAAGLITSLAKSLQQGAIVMIDYGFSAREYYHPQRNHGTLMCHYQQYAHTDPLINIGLQDITAHVDFTCIAQAGVDNGLTLDGFCNQAQFLMNSGMLELMSHTSASDIALYLPMVAAAQKLLSPAEMGDLFKVIGFTKNIDKPLIGFTTGDKSHTL